MAPTTIRAPALASSTAMSDSPFSRNRLQSQIKEAAISFGRNLRFWRESNGWSQNTPVQWARAISMAQVPNSTWSNLENGILAGPRPLVFLALGAMNGLIHVGDYGTITNRLLRDQLSDSRALCHPDGQPWSGPDFYAAYIGELAWPAEFGAPDPFALVSAQEAEELSASLREQFRSIATARGIRPAEALDKLMALVPQEHQDQLEDVLHWGSYSPEQLQQLRSDDGTLAPTAWLAAWAA